MSTRSYKGHISQHFKSLRAAFEFPTDEAQATASRLAYFTNMARERHVL